MPLYFWLRRLTGQKLMQLRRFHLGTKARDPRREISLDQGDALETSAAALADFLVRSVKTPSEELLLEEKRSLMKKTKARLQEALETMDPKEREVLALRHFEKLSNAEIARLLDMKESAASKRYFRALGKLEKLIGDLREFDE